MTLDGKLNPTCRGISNPGLTISLSGGGFRATLFHLGALQRLNELGVLAQVNTITSVSGGSILNGVLSTRWSKLRIGSQKRFENFIDLVGTAITDFCARDLRTRLLLGARLNPRNWLTIASDCFAVRANFLAEAYQNLLEHRKLRDLPIPGEKAPRFVFCATNVRTGAAWQFHSGPEGRMGDFYTDYCTVGPVKVAQAVAASSAFPPGFGALRLEVPRNTSWSRVDPWGRNRPTSQKRRGAATDNRDLILLTDGGVYDNLGLEPIWSSLTTVLLSDAGKPFDSSDKCHQWVIPRLRRAADISAEQVGAVRKRWLLERFRSSDERTRLAGTMWAINTQIEDYKLADAQGYGREVRQLFPLVRTDLNAFSTAEIGCLVNHGYSLADAAMRSWGREFCLNAAAPFQWPDQKASTDDIASRALIGSRKRRFVRDVFQLVRRKA